MAGDDLIASLSPAACEIQRKLAGATPEEQRFAAATVGRALLTVWERIVDARAAGGLPPVPDTETEIERLAVEISRPSRGGTDG